jgi:valyl-tRNA synthetase
VVPRNALSLVDKWIVDCLNGAIREVTTAIDRYDFNVAAMKVYDFIWHEFCDWYIELSKDALKDLSRQAAARFVIIHCFDQMLRLLHPFMPFLSEEIWQVIRPYIAEADLAPNLPMAKFPPRREEHVLSDAEALAMRHCIEATQAVNLVRGLTKQHPGARIDWELRPIKPRPLDSKTVEDLSEDEEKDFKREFSTWQNYLKIMGKTERIEVIRRGANSPGSVEAFVLSWCVGYVVLSDPAAREALRKEFQKQDAEANQHYSAALKRENDPIFLERASAETKSANTAKVQELSSKIANLSIILNKS